MHSDENSMAPFFFLVQYSQVHQSLKKVNIQVQGKLGILSSIRDQKTKSSEIRKVTYTPEDRYLNPNSVRARVHNNRRGSTLLLCTLGERYRD